MKYLLLIPLFFLSACGPQYNTTCKYYQKQVDVFYEKRHTDGAMVKTEVTRYNCALQIVEIVR